MTPPQTRDCWKRSLPPLMTGPGTEGVHSAASQPQPQLFPALSLGLGLLSSTQRPGGVRTLKQTRVKNASPLLRPFGNLKWQIWPTWGVGPFANSRSKGSGQLRTGHGF